ncbi:MAG TPA: DJ-1/PfpI family protein [Pyrinomonadaceae bacterium]|nr:DJ-1/PfpI family protein [Pyrinomonadaceae bacterium]
MNFGFLLFPDAEELDLAGPWEIVNVWRKYAGGPERCLTVSQAGGEVRFNKGMRLVADHSFEDCPRLDCLLVPGGQGTRREVGNAELLEFVRRQAASCRHVLSVCTGSFILEAAGLLSGKTATTHWGSLDRLREFSEVRVTEERFTRDGNVWTAAGVSAGIDLALAFIADQAGEEVAGQVQLYAEYYPNGKRYGRAHLDPKAPAYLRTS